MPEYRVSVEGLGAFPVTAPNQAAARNHVAKNLLKVSKLTMAEAIQFGKDGVEMQTAGEETPEAAPGTELPEGSDAPADGEAAGDRAS